MAGDLLINSGPDSQRQNVKAVVLVVVGVGGFLPTSVFLPFLLIL